MNKYEYVRPADIEKESMRIIEAELKERGIEIPEENMTVVKRVIHTSADFDYGTNLKFTDGAVRRVVEALREGDCTFITDTNMALSGISKPSLKKLSSQAFCYMADEDVAKEAKERELTRAYVSMDRAMKIPKPVIYVVGNAPTALISLMEASSKNGYRPAFIIGVPVGFVNVEAAKELVLDSDLDYIVNKGRKGGSNVAAAIFNAVLYQCDR